MKFVYGSTCLFRNINEKYIEISDGNINGIQIIENKLYLFYSAIVKRFLNQIHYYRNHGHYLYR